MQHQGGYTEYHPRWLRRPLSTCWWLERRAYLAFILREVSSVFVLWSVYLLLMIAAAALRGEEGLAALLAWSRSPHVLLLNAVSFVFVTLHAVTWFNLASRALVVRAGPVRVPGQAIAAANYAAWAAVSAAIARLVLGG